MAGLEAPEWSDRWPQCRLLLELAQLAMCNGRPEVCRRLRERLQVCRLRLRGAPVLVDNTLSELWLAAGLALEGDLPAARRHTLEAGRKADRVERLRRDELRRKARALCCQARQLKARTQQLRRESEALLVASRALLATLSGAPEPAVLASIA
ncbi:MAG TPA: hypothetical protein VFE33_17795 [Thermoanaerobaculia bacterium]|nr:hypothetical protein [Thermoanaerobaculia bacterium]